jgi:hypothetical protein
VRGINYKGVIAMYWKINEDIPHVQLTSESDVEDMVTAYDEDGNRLDLDYDPNTDAQEGLCDMDLAVLEEARQASLKGLFREYGEPLDFTKLGLDEEAEE